MKLKKKKDGGTITNWQLHYLTFSDEQMEEFKREYSDAPAKPMVFTGTVVEDKAGRWKSGFHMRSSLIVYLNREDGIIETLNTVYKVQNEGNDVLPNLGNDVLKIFY